MGGQEFGFASTIKGSRAKSPGIQGVFAASNSSLTAWNPNSLGGGVSFVTGGTGGAHLYTDVQFAICVDDCSLSEDDLEGRAREWERQPVPVGSSSESSGAFSLAERKVLHLPTFDKVMVAVGGDYLKPEESKATAAFSTDFGKSWTAAETPPHGYRSAVEYDYAAKEWITVGPNGTDISTDDGKNWSALRPDVARGEAADADRNWNALSLPFVVGPQGRIGKRNQGSGITVQSPLGRGPVRGAPDEVQGREK